MTNDIGIDAAEQSRIERASEEIRNMADDLKPVATGLEPMLQRITDDLYYATRRAPIQTLIVAFLLGVLVARRR